MELLYDKVTGQITGARIEYVPLDSKLTEQEKRDFFACDAPNQVVWESVGWLEKGATNLNGTPKATMESVVALMVSEKLITQERADEILA